MTQRQVTKNNSQNDIPMMVRSSLFTALIIVGAYIRLPIGPVPITLSSFFVLLSPILLGKKWALISVLLYLLLGALGFPVFSAGGGLVLFLGPTGGYLIGYIPTVVVTAVVAGEKRYSAVRTAAGLCAGTIVIYAMGVTWLKLILEISWPAAVTAGMVPFLFGDGVKIIAAAAGKAVILKTASGLFPLLENQSRQSRRSSQSGRIEKAKPRGTVP
jgi:biotin transport system substrate-specific component